MPVRTPLDSTHFSYFPSLTFSTYQRGKTPWRQETINLRNLQVKTEVNQDTTRTDVTCTCIACAPVQSVALPLAQVPLVYTFEKFWTGFLLLQTQGWEDFLRTQQTHSVAVVTENTRVISAKLGDVPSGNISEPQELRWRTFSAMHCQRVVPEQKGCVDFPAVRFVSKNQFCQRTGSKIHISFFPVAGVRGCSWAWWDNDFCLLFCGQANEVLSTRGNTSWWTKQLRNHWGLLTQKNRKGFASPQTLVFDLRWAYQVKRCASTQLSHLVIFSVKHS